MVNADIASLQAQFKAIREVLRGISRTPNQPEGICELILQRAATPHLRDQLGIEALEQAWTPARDA